VEPLSHNEAVSAYYGYANAHAHPSTDILESDTSHLFLYEEPDGELYLVAIHDIPSHGSHGSKFDTGGGAVDFEFPKGLPPGFWSVRDDFGGDSYSSNKVEWGWSKRNTDGGAYGDIGSGFDITISPSFNEEAARFDEFEGEISFWCFLSGDADDPDEVRLDMDADARVVHTAEAPCEAPITDLPEECLIETPIDIKPCSDPNAINPDGKGLIPVGIKGTSDLDVTDVVVDSLRFGAVGHVEAEPAHDGHIEDTVPCEGDGTDDLVVHFPTEDTGFEKGDDIGKLTGELQDGTAIIGFDSVKIVGDQGKGGGKGN
jgi:hypothetical protein